MKDTEKKRPATSDEWMDYISEFAHKWELGTPEHRAVNDFLNLQRLYKNFGKVSQNHLTKMSGEAYLSVEDRKNLDLQKIALLEHTIEQHQAAIPGYSNAYVNLSISFQGLIGAAATEANAKFSGDEAMQESHIRDLYEETLDYVYEDVFEKQNPNL
jgi:hypothetical protein